MSLSEATSFWDPFLGSGTTVLAAERSGWVYYAMELDLQYVHTATRRRQASDRLDRDALQSNRSFTELEQEVPNGQTAK